MVEKSNCHFPAFFFCNSTNFIFIKFATEVPILLILTLLTYVEYVVKRNGKEFSHFLSYHRIEKLHLIEGTSHFLDVVARESQDLLTHGLKKSLTSTKANQLTLHSVEPNTYSQAHQEIRESLLCNHNREILIKAMIHSSKDECSFLNHRPLLEHPVSIFPNDLEPCSFEGEGANSHHCPLMLTN